MTTYPTEAVDPTHAAEKAAKQPDTPPLNPGDRLTRAEFERRYQAHPEIKKAELIEGVVFMPSPVRYTQHGKPHFNVIGWLSAYQAATPGISGGDNVTVKLDNENEAQPDVLLRIPAEKGGRSQVDEDDYLQGPPELIVEIAASSAAYDLHDKKRVYARSGVPEYLVIQMYEQRIDWFVLREGVYASLEPDDDGVIRSEIFPGLWLDTAAFWAGDLAQMLQTGQKGIESDAQAQFVARLVS